VSTFFWNVHWECSVGQAAGSHPDCKEKVGKRFVELASQTGADIVFSCMLADSRTKPSQLKDFGLAEGWTQVDGPCVKPNGGGDTTALAFGPGWHVDASGAGCLRHDHDARAFAVALVKPPSPIRGCPKLCVLGVHAPHSQITQGNELVKQVCGAAAKACSIAMGDWNIDASKVGRHWKTLIGGSVPEEVVPDVKTCCWPEDVHWPDFRYDHVATNVPGALHVSHEVHDYQHTDLKPRVQHRPVSAHMVLPRAEGMEDM